MKFDKDITKIKRVTFFLRHSVVVSCQLLADFVSSLFRTIFLLTLFERSAMVTFTYSTY